MLQKDAAKDMSPSNWPMWTKGMARETLPHEAPKDEAPLTIHTGQQWAPGLQHEVSI